MLTELVFHNRRFTQDERDEIVFRRNAEVLVPDHLTLAETLRFVACRSVAERHTLLHLLPPNLRRAWSPRIRIGDHGLFLRKWTYVEQAVTTDDRIIFRFNPNTLTPGPFKVSFVYQEVGRDAKGPLEATRQTLNDELRIRIPDAVRGDATLQLDDALAYDGRVTFDEVPF